MCPQKIRFLPWAVICARTHVIPRRICSPGNYLCIIHMPFISWTFLYMYPTEIWYYFEIIPTFRTISLRGKCFRLLAWDYCRSNILYPPSLANNWRATLIFECVRSVSGSLLSVCDIMSSTFNCILIRQFVWRDFALMLNLELSILLLFVQKKKTVSLNDFSPPPLFHIFFIM